VSNVLRLVPLLMFVLAGCIDATEGIDDDGEIASTSSALSAPQVLELVNTCDQSAVSIVAGSTPDKFVLDPGDGSRRFKGKLGPNKLACVVGVKFNVPAFHRARMGIATTVGSWTTSASSNGAVFQNQAGFTTQRPLLPSNTQHGPSFIDTKFLPRASSGTLDVQVDHNDQGVAQFLITECGAPNTWIYVRPAIDTPTASVDLSLILESFRLEPC